ncbi:MAG: Hsp70 family protein [Methermicoccaceae archaeon]
MYIGIDLGTTSSEACWINDKGEPVIIPAKEGATGGKNFPSVVAFKDEKVYVGLQAKRLPVSDKITAFKRYMGTSWKYHSETLNKDFTPQELSALVLKKIKEDSEVFLNSKVTGAVITVPAYFDDNQRQATKDAARIAGIECKRIINEPTAACIAYGLGKEVKAKIAVLDLGGGTFDVSILSVDKGTFQVLSTSGDTQLGGRDMDEALFRYLIKEKLDPKLEIAVWDAVERAKMDLSSSDSTYIFVPGVVEAEITRELFEELIEPILKRLEKPIEQALSDAGLEARDIDKVVLIGGGTKVPAVRKRFAGIFGEEKIVGGVDPMRGVAVGAGIVAAVLENRWKGEAPLLIDVIPLSLGVEIKGGLMSKLIERNTPIPCRATKTFTTTQDFQERVAIRVYQGEREFVKDNIYLGELILDGILPAPAGVPKIDVMFEVDENGVINVEAVDRGTNKKRKITIQAPHRLTEEEIKRMLKEAEKFHEADKEKRREIELREKAEHMLNAVESLPDEYRKEVVEDVERVNSAKNVKELEESIGRLEKKLTEIAKRIYGKGGEKNV